MRMKDSTRNIIVLLALSILIFFAGRSSGIGHHGDVQVFKEGKPVLNICQGITAEDLSVIVSNDGSYPELQLGSGTPLEIMFTTGKIYFVSFLTENGESTAAYLPVASVIVTGCQ